MADWTEDTNATLSLLLSAVDAIHEALVVDAVPQAELMTDLVTHDSTASHQKIFLSFRVFNAIKGWIVPAERKGADTFCKTGPAETEIPFGLRVQVLHGDAEHGIVVSRTILRQHAQDATLATSLKLQLVSPVISTTGHEAQEVLRNTSFVCLCSVLSGNHLALLYNANLLTAKEES